MRWHYQWVVVHDYLERITQPGMVTEILNPGGTPRLQRYLKKEAQYPYMPVEFSGAAFRFGHSQVRPSYSLNNIVLTDKHAGADPLVGRIPTFARPPADVNPDDPDFNAQNLNGFPGTLVPFWGMDWSFFFDGLPVPTKANPALKGQRPRLPQPSYRMDALLVGPLKDLPEFFAATDATGPTSLIGNLAFRNLLRGQNLGLPSGQQAAVEYGIQPMSDDIIWGAGSRLLDESTLDDDAKEGLDKTREARAGDGGPLHENTPLWFYILREGEYYGVERKDDDAGIGFGGQHLGPLGSRIVAETLIGLLWLDKRSYLHAHRRFEPLDAIAGDGPLTLPVLLTYALT